MRQRQICWKICCKEVRTSIPIRIPCFGNFGTVKNEKDQAVFDYTKQFDGADITADTITVTKEEIAQAYDLVDESLVEIIRKAKENIRIYHEKQKQYSWFDSKQTEPCLGKR